MIKRIIRLLQRYRTQVALTLSGFIVPLITNLTSSWLESTFGSSSAQLIQLIAILVAFSGAVLGILAITRLGPQRWSSFPREMQPTPKQGLIVIVGPGQPDSAMNIKENVAYHAIDFHHKGGRLKQVWALTTREGAPVYEHLRTMYGAQIHFNPPLLVKDALSISESYAVVRKIYQELIPAAGISPDDVIADITGGMKPMSVGLALACANLLPMQYVTRIPGAASTVIQTDYRSAAKAED